MSVQRKVLLTHSADNLAKYYGERALAELRSLAEVRLNETGEELSLEALIEAAKGCDVIVSYRQTPGSAELFRSLPDLVAFVRCAIDVRNIDIAAASGEGILVTQASAGFVASVAEWTIGAMIDLGRRITASSQAYHAGRVPEALMGRELRGSALGVIGYGQISRYLCRLARAFGMTVAVHDPYADVDGPAIDRMELGGLLGTSDYVVCLAAATDETENLMNAERFAEMRRGAFFINPSRGNLVDETALAEALDSGRLAGAAMDVGRAPDQMPSRELARHPNVIATPHTGGLTPPAIEHQSLETVRQTAAILKGEAPEGALNAEQAQRLARLRR